MGWASLLKAGGKAAGWLGRGTRAAAEAAGRAALHPGQTVRGAASAVKSAAIGGGVGYIGWKKLTTDDSVVSIVGDAVIGSETTDRISRAVDCAADGLHDLKENVADMAGCVSEAVKDADSRLGGISSFISDMSSGNGLDRLEGFLDNLLHGRVSGLGMMGLVLSAFLIFGRSGWMGKIAGVMLAMMTVGNNSHRAATQPAQRSDAPDAADACQKMPQIYRQRR